jgi:solute carrier family 25 carnitine/acylcarnitine transporter 20/29
MAKIRNYKMWIFRISRSLSLPSLLTVPRIVLLCSSSLCVDGYHPCQHMKSERLDSRLHGFAAGIIAGGAGVCVGHPFDTLKVSMQVASEKNPNPFNNKSSWLQSILRLYRGILPPLVSTGMVQSLNFGVYENTKTWLKPSVMDETPMWVVTTAAFISGAATSPLTAIVTKFKLLQQVKGKSVMNIIGGIQHLQPFKYFYVHCTLESFGRAVYMSTYVGSKRFVQYNGYNSNDLLWRVVCGATSGVVAWTSIYPLDVMRSRLFSGNGEHGIVSAFKVMQKEKAMFRGLGFTLVRAAPVAGVVLTCYDLVLDRIRGTV